MIAFRRTERREYISFPYDFISHLLDFIKKKNAFHNKNIIANLFFYKIPLIVDHAKLMTHLFEN